jgi:glycosyltransferase involved in cell wall biosynthesis
MEYGAALLLPVRVPLVSGLLNRISPLLPGINRLCVVQTLIVRKAREYPASFTSTQTCTVVIPCFNEHGNIEEACRRIPNMGGGTEIIVVDDGSTDGTAEAVRAAAAHDSRVRLITYSPNHGKGYAVKQGFDHAKGDIIMILDADMTVKPEDLPRFFRPIAEGSADFTNGTRMIYPMEHQAMRFLNLMGNFFFGTIMTWLVSQRLSDTLCGTKALRKKDYPHIPMGGDKWGDFDLLFGAAENRLKIAEIPIHYQARVQGVSKMKPFRHSLVLMKMCLRGFLRLKLKIRSHV